MLVFANVRERWTSFLAAFGAVLVGVALITTTLIIYDSSRPQVQSRLSAASAIAVPDQAVDQDKTPEDRVPWSRDEAQPLIDELDAMPGVGSVVVDRSFYAQAFLGSTPVEDEDALTAGHGWSSARLAPYNLVTGRAPAAADEIVVDRALGVAAGTTLTVNITAGRSEFRVVGTVDGPGYYFTDDFATRQQPGVGAIAMLADNGASVSDIKARAERVVGDKGTVLSGDGRAALQPAYVEHKRFLGTQLIGAMATLGLFTTVFVVASMLVLATGLRRREIGLLRMIGASPRQVRRMILGEAAFIGLLGSLAGCLVGIGAWWCASGALSVSWSATWRTEPGTVRPATCTRGSWRGRSLPTTWRRSSPRSGDIARTPTRSPATRRGERWSTTRGTSRGLPGALLAGEHVGRSDRAGCSGARLRIVGSGCRGRRTRPSHCGSRATASRPASMTVRSGLGCSRRRGCSRT
jgi:hypothetical protein